MASFDDELSSSAPSVPVATVELERELMLVVAEAERMARPRRVRARPRLAIGGLVALGALGLGTAAAGAAGVLPWFETAPSHSVVTTSSGAECQITLGIKGVDDLSRPTGARTRAEAVAAAERFLADFDVSTIDVQAAARELPPRRTVDSEAGPAESVEDYEAFAVMVAVEQRVDADLARQGLPTSAASVSLASSCGDAAP